MNQQITAWCGIDVSKATFDAAFLTNESYQQIRNIPVAQFSNDAKGVRRFILWIEELEKAAKVPVSGVRVVMEATGRYATQLHSRLVEKRSDFAPAIINPAVASQFRESLFMKQKDDTIDARALSYFGRDREPRAYQPPSKEVLEIRRLVGVRRSLVQDRVRWKQRQQEAEVQSEKARIKAIITTFTEQIKELEKEIRALIGKAKEFNDDVALLMTIPGVGYLTAATVICVAGDLRRFNTRQECASYAGCSPRIVQSGSSVRKKPRLSKAGNRFLRQTLYMASLTAMRAKNSVFKQTYERLIGNGKAPKQALGAIMRKMIVMMRSMLKSGEPYRFEGQTLPQTRGTA